MNGNNQPKLVLNVACNGNESHLFVAEKQMSIIIIINANGELLLATKTFLIHSNYGLCGFALTQPKPMGKKSQIQVIIHSNIVAWQYNWSILM